MASVKDLQDLIGSIGDMNQVSPTWQETTIALFLVFGISMFIFFIYRVTYRGVLYNHSFNVSLVMIAMVTALIIMCIYVNILLSLGMVGALSIVRFRTPIKDPRDIVFMFWAITVGLACGALFFQVAIVGTIIIGWVVLMFSLVDFRFSGAEPYILVVNYASEADVKVRKSLPSATVRSRTVTQEGVELTLEIRLKQEETIKVDKLLKIEGVRNAALVSYNGDYVS